MAMAAVQMFARKLREEARKCHIDVEHSAHDDIMEHQILYYVDRWISPSIPQCFRFVPLFSFYFLPGPVRVLDLGATFSGANSIPWSLLHFT